jgi:hypothetical protein
MKGPAGVGKSAIAQTCAEKLKELGLLGASFFFSMNGCDDPTRFFPSIAYQLAIELPEYRDLLDKKVFNDKTLAKKTVKAQFRGLIVEPFVELERIGNMQSRRAIFVDGLDECGDKDAQREIVELVGTWVGNRSTSSCWAFFSRPEPHLESTFANPNLSPLCHVTILPISREADREIELYLRSGLENVLRRRNISLSYSWPSDREVQALVAAAAGLFIYPATLIRFMDRTCRSPEELMNIVHGSFASPGGPRTLSAEGSHQLFAELDAFYTLILRRIPVDIFPTVQLLLALAVMTPFESCVWGAVGLSNLLGFSEAKFRLVCSELHAVLHFQDYGDLSTISDLSISRIIDATRPFDISERVMMDWLRQSVSRLGGVLTFYHKSFYDFLRDPTRSQTFCVTAANVQNDLFKLRLGIHLKYADGYSTQGQGRRSFCFPRNEAQELTFLPDLIQVAKSSTSEDVLSWPQDIQLVDSYIKAVTFNNTGFVLLHLFCPYDHLDAQLIKQLADFDFRKHLLSQPYIFSSDYLSRSTVFGMPSMAKYVHGCAAGTLLCSIPPTLFHTFDADRFFEVSPCIRYWGSHPN